MNPIDIYKDDILRGHVALVTGGGSGICKGIARAYSRLGAEVAIVSRKQDVLDAAAKEFRAFPVAADVRDPAQLATAVAKTVEKFGKLDTLVNGAAGNFLAPAAALSPNGFKTVIEIDLLGTFQASKAAFEAMCAAGNGLILNISATLHYHGTPLQVHAAAAKAGVDSVTRCLAVEWARFGIRTCGIAPGPIDETEGMRKLAPGDIKARATKSIPLGRFGTIDEIAAAAVFLRSNAAAYVNGEVIVVDGGQCLAQPWLLE